MTATIAGHKASCSRRLWSDQCRRRMREIIGAIIPTSHGMQGRMRLRGGQGSQSGAQIIDGDQRISPLRGQPLGERGFARERGTPDDDHLGLRPSSLLPRVAGRS